jgi:organic hydroperoxide reductase OsmC/OhrA
LLPTTPSPHLLEHFVKVLYTARATVTGEGRNGHGRSSDGLLDVDLATPEELGGAGRATNPEQLSPSATRPASTRR